MERSRWFDLDLSDVETGANGRLRKITGAEVVTTNEETFVRLERVGTDCCGCCGWFTRRRRPYPLQGGGGAGARGYSNADGEEVWEVWSNGPQAPLNRGADPVAIAAGCCAFSCALIVMLLLLVTVWSIDSIEPDDAGSGLVLGDLEEVSARAVVALLEHTSGE